MPVTVKLTLALAFAALTSSAQTPVPITHPTFPTGPTTPLGAQIDALLADPVAAHDHWGIAVTTLDGTPIYGHDEGEYFRPASNTKLFTTAAAMALLKPESTVTTSVWFLKPSADGTSRGGITLIGAGDANISGQAFPYKTPAERRAEGTPATATPPADPLQYLDQFAAEVAKAGVRRIQGRVNGSDELWTYEPYPEAWGIDDMTWGYGAPISALSIVDNQLELTVTPGNTPGAQAVVRVVPDVGYYQFSVQVATVPANTHADVEIDRAPGSKLVRLYGTVAEGEPYKTEIAIQDPAEFAAQAFKLKLQQHGIEVTDGARAFHRPLTDTEGFFRESHEPLTLTDHVDPDTECGASCPQKLSHTSPTLAEDVKLTLKLSQNLHAELMLQRLGAKFGEPDDIQMQSFGEPPVSSKSTTAQGTRVVRQFLLNAGLDGDDFIFFDGSGMSSHDLVAPRATVKLLAYATTQPWFAAWKIGLPIGGEDGTLRSRFPVAPLKDHVFAKTGTLGESRALSGYVDCASGKQVIFSIMVDDHSPGTAADRITMDKIVAAIAAAE